MEPHENPGKAAGSNDHEHQHRKDAVSASRSQHAYERPPVSSYNIESDQRHSFTSVSIQQPHALDRRMSEHHDMHPQHSKLPQDQPFNSTQSHSLQDQTSTSIDDWDLLEHDKQEQKNVPLSNSPSPTSLTHQSNPLRLSPEPGPPLSTIPPPPYPPSPLQPPPTHQHSRAPDSAEQAGLLVARSHSVPTMAL
jgi:hypothetical protein